MPCILPTSPSPTARFGHILQCAHVWTLKSDRWTVMDRRKFLELSASGLFLSGLSPEILAMHSACELMGVRDMKALSDCVTAFFGYLGK